MLVTVMFSHKINVSITCNNRTHYRFNVSRNNIAKLEKLLVYNGKLISHEQISGGHKVSYEVRIND